MSWPDAIEIERIVPASGNMTIGPQQFWLATSRTGQTVRFWIDTTTVHLSIGGWRIKTVPSRLSAVDLARLRHNGARPAGPPPAGSAGRDHLRGSAAAGQRRGDHHPGQPGRSGRLPAGRAARPHPPGRPGHARHHPGRRLAAHPALPDPARPAAPAAGRPPRRARPLPQSRPSIQRKVSSRGGIQVARQRIQVGFSHAGQTVTIELGDTTLRVTGQHGELVTTIPRTGNGEITRFKAYGTRQPG